ncbi:DUF6384 family protein [Pseudomonas carassii]|uniref:DUF6384 family protein n=1 Tax=Pseudomonas carassii TaxID=3115855 RepID=A0ABU7HH55_9PSED|nr:DUF6384 family protein [Pseudomonas sp. 137P]MEE1890645.1 DUF6384 family protein [Pseudomonas sp. 137P]
MPGARTAPPPAGMQSMSIPLSERIGAMGLVDQLRHREMAIQEHLDLPRRRAEVAEGIRTYYQSHGIAFDEATVEEGVRQFFARRLEFQAPALGFTQRLLTRLAMAYRPLLKGVAYSVLLIALGLGTLFLVESGLNIRAGLSADQLAIDVQLLQMDLAAQRQRLEQSKARQARQPVPVVADLLVKVERLLPSPSQSLNVVRPDPITRDNRAPFNARIEQAYFVLAGAQNNLAKARKRLNRVEHVYISLDRQQQLQDRLNAMPLPKADHEQLADWLNRAGEDIAKLQLEKADSTLDAVKDYLIYAAEPLTIELIDRPGIKSGVERCYENAGCSPNSTRGKSWYLIVEPFDAAGKQTWAPVTSVETGKTRWANRFGVRVSYDEYLRVRQDKLEDGHISQRLIGRKPVNSLSIHFSQSTYATPDMILEW